jgi:hypothetical protein
VLSLVEPEAPAKIVSVLNVRDTGRGLRVVFDRRMLYILVWPSRIKIRPHLIEEAL